MNKICFSLYLHPVYPFSLFPGQRAKIVTLYVQNNTSTNLWNGVEHPPIWTMYRRKILSFHVDFIYSTPQANLPMLCCQTIWSNVGITKSFGFRIYLQCISNLSQYHLLAYNGHKLKGLGMEAFQRFWRKIITQWII